MTKIEYLRGQMAAHPATCPQDLLKHSYQAAFGAEHLLTDLETAKRYFNEEFAAVAPREGELCEIISDHVCRVYLDVWKQKGLPAEWLFSLFIQSKPERESIGEWLDAVEELTGERINESYRRAPHPVHHSEEYRKAEKPSYRVVSRHLCRLIPILEKMGRVTAIDGRAAAGKTTLARELADVTGACVIHMDDFFLPMELRTPERLGEAGGNIHYERFEAEVLPFLKEDAPFTYQRFDCSQMALAEYKTVGRGMRIVEGSYSHHPRFGEYADLAVFCDVEAEEQMRRIRRRNPDLAERFEKEWIPMEEAYINTYGIRKGLIVG